MTRKLLVVFGVLVMSLSGSISCSKPATPPPSVTYSVLYNNKAASPFRDDWLILQEYEKRQNVVLDVRLGDDADYDQAISQTFESGDVPDIVLKVWPQTVESYASAGLLLPFSDYEDRMPFFMAYVKENQLESELDKLRLGNGKYYILPGFQRTVQVQQWIYRRDLFEKHNLGAPATYDELFDALVILKAAYPDSAPITACWGGAHLFAMMGAGYGIPAGWAGTRFYDSAADVWRFSPATERYRAMYSFLHRCYAAGLLDPALFTQTDAEYIDKLQSGTALVTVSWVSSGFASWDAKLEQNGVSGGEWAPLRVPASTMGIRAMPAVDPFRKGLVVASRVANEPYLDRLLGFLDWAVYSEEGRTLTAWGVEGVTYTNTDAGKAFVPDVQTPRNPAGTKVIEKDYGLDIMFDLNANAEYEDYKRPPEIVAFLDESLKAAEAAKVDPPLQLSPDAVETARIISDKLGPYVAESGTRFVVGELSTDTDWDGYLLELDRRGYKALEDTWNRAWAAQSQR